MIPGLGSDARAYIPLAAYLASRYQCILYDLPTGRGDGARMGLYDLNGLSCDVFALLDHLGVREANLIGWSFGSTIALRSMATMPDRIGRAVLLGGFAHRRLAPAEAILVRLLRHCHFPMRRLPFHDRLMARAHREPFTELPPEMWEYFLQRCGAAPVAVVAHRALILHGADLRPDLPRIRVPVLLVTGELGPLVPAACAEDLRQGLPNAAQAELAGCGHFAALSHTPVLAEVISRFLLACSEECHAAGQCVAK
jgi:aminoacrylate hydrolase